ncbi:GAF domain-containing protein [Streptomyces sp. NPDC046909]|uniref:GAF domain-containing protein n=1 Tax=Streptomyces sp. NPDC046909 TaxID=3155617 RepID=UPI0033E5404D
MNNAPGLTAGQPSSLLDQGQAQDWQAQLPDHFDPASPPMGAFDAFARMLADAAGAPYGIVNWFGPHEQVFVGVANPTGSDLPLLGRSMPYTHGFCPHVATLRQPFVLHDTLAYADFASNPVIDEFGVRWYAGAPLIDQHTNQVRGTICLIGPEPHDRSTSRQHWQLMGQYGGLLMDDLALRTSPH